MQKILINVEGGEKRIAVLKNNILEDFSLERVDNRKVVGNVYKGKVDNVMPGMQAAFVNIGLEKNAFLHSSDVLDSEVSCRELLEEETEPVSHNGNKLSGKIENLIKKDQDILVQVVKDQIGSKGARITTNISLPGRYLVLMPNSPKSGISRKISSKDERTRLRSVLSELKAPKGMGIIVRTVGGGEETKKFKRDLKYLLGEWKRIRRRRLISKTPCCLHKELDIVLKTLRDVMSDDIDEILVDDKREFRIVKRFVSIIYPEARHKVRFYDGREPMFDKFGVESEISKALSRKVWLKCGGSIVIDRTEALTTVDVNTSKHIGSKNLEDTVHRTNMEASEEIALQLKLRNIGGIIIIDFIDMKSKRNQKAVLRKLEECLKKDRAKTYISAISPLGLVEMTRQRVKESWIGDMYETCKCCSGKGVIKNSITISLEIIRNTRRILGKYKNQKLKILCNSAIAGKLENYRDLKILKRKFRVEVEIVGDYNKNFEDVTYYDSDGKEIDLKRL
ncbi:MAG: Rne/Rng family ribonuclease [bacterium]|nr:Rne/Rng family ribonuclease [bacterium]